MHDNWRLAFGFITRDGFCFIGKRLDPALAWRTGMGSRHDLLYGIGSSLPLEEVWQR